MAVAFARPLASTLEHRAVLWSFVRRDWQAKYRGSVLGTFWSLAGPFSLVAIYTIFFAGILQIRLRSTADPTDFALFLMCGIIPWMSFSEAVMRSSNSIVDQSNLVKRVKFPLDVLPQSICISAVVSELIGFTILLATIVLITGHINLILVVLFIPLLLVLQIMLTNGISWFVASLGVFFRDMSHLLNICLTAWMFLTPIFYEVERVPAPFRIIVLLNPMTWLVTAYRSVLLDSALPDLRFLALLVFAAYLTALIGHYWFLRSSRVFADVL